MDARFVHAENVRCPDCGHVMENPGDIDYRDESFGMYCYECDAAFDVGIYRELKFVSPPLKLPATPAGE